MSCIFRLSAFYPAANRWGETEEAVAETLRADAGTGSTGAEHDITPLTARPKSAARITARLIDKTGAGTQAWYESKRSGTC
jgi:hypothetical protein